MNTGGGVAAARDSSPGGARRTSSTRCAGWITPSVASVAAVSRVFSSARMLSGQRWASRARSAGGENRRSLAPGIWASSARSSRPKSARRSASVGSASVNPEIRPNRSSRNSPRSTSPARSRWVAAHSRTSTLTGRSSPIGTTSRSCRTRRNAVCEAGGSSPISSRNSVPPSALRTSPVRSPTAPVNAPRRWPNSSASSSDAGSAPQLTATNAPVRPDIACSARATTSLPVPVSPSTTIDTGVGASRPSAAKPSASGPENVASAGDAGSSPSIRSAAAPCSTGCSQNSRKLWPSSISAPSLTTLWRVTWPSISEPFLDPGSSSTQPAGPRTSRPCWLDIQASGIRSSSTRVSPITVRVADLVPRPNRTSSISPSRWRDDGACRSSLTARTTRYGCTPGSGSPVRPCEMLVMVSPPRSCPNLSCTHPDHAAIVPCATPIRRPAGTARDAWRTARSAAPGCIRICLPG